MINKNLSRSGAAPQRKFRGAKNLVAPLRRCASMFLLLSLTFTAFGQRTRFDPDGSFWLHESTPQPNGFSDFGGINLNAKNLRRLPSPGLQLIDGTTYRFKTLTVKRENFTFTTVARRGISYSFSGKFLKGGVYAAGDLDPDAPVLEGTLRKFRGGKKIAEANLKFVYFGGT